MDDKNHTSLLLPCLRGAMGDWIYYVTLMQFEDVASRVKLAHDLHEHKEIEDLIEKTVGEKSDIIGDYICSQKQRFFNAIVVGLYLGNPVWHQIEVRENKLIIDKEIPELVKESIGILSLSGNEILFAIDGKHRVEGIRKAIAIEDELRDDEQAVIFVAHKNEKSGKERTRRLASILNKT